jgi:hypothetical protein
LLVHPASHEYCALLALYAALLCAPAGWTSTPGVTKSE